MHGKDASGAHRPAPPQALSDLDTRWRTRVRSQTAVHQRLLGYAESMRLSNITPKGRREVKRRRAARFVLIAGALAAAAFATLRDARRRQLVRDRAIGRVRQGVATARRHSHREYDDVTLTRKVESELFRPADAPKGSVSVNVQYGVVELRGQVERPEEIDGLARAAARVHGVKDVHNLLHTPGSPPKHSPPSDPDEVRARARHPQPVSGFARARRPDH